MSLHCFTRAMIVAFAPRRRESHAFDRSGSIASHSRCPRDCRLGEPRATDPIWLNRLWEMDANKRAELVLTNAAARQAALREPELAGIDSRVYEHAIQRQLVEHHERDLAFLNAAVEAQKMHDLMIRELEKAVLSVPVVVERNGAVRPFIGVPELAHWIKTALPGQIPLDASTVVPARPASIVEEAAFDIVDEAA